MQPVNDYCHFIPQAAVVLSHWCPHLVSPGLAAGVEDGVNNENVAREKLYSSPEDVYKGEHTLSSRIYPLIGGHDSRHNPSSADTMNHHNP
eukprot:scaffold161880_cov28-Tisochrysis_lutea.AAC.3